MNDTLSELRALPHISVSQVKIFIGCPRKFRLRHIDRAEPAFRSAALALGRAWHRTIGHMLTTATEGKKPNGELHEHLRDGLAHELHDSTIPVLFDEGESEELLMARAMTMLDACIEKVELPDQVLGVEVPFSIELVDTETGELLPVPLIGGIDAIVMKNGAPTIIELKTSKKKWGQNELDFELQPTAYRIVAEALGFGEPPLELCITTKTKNPDVQIEGLVRTEADERDLVETATSVLRAVDAGVGHPIRVGSAAAAPARGSANEDGQRCALRHRLGRERAAQRHGVRGRRRY